MGLHVFFGCYHNLFRLMTKCGVLENLLVKEHTHTFVNSGLSLLQSPFDTLKKSLYCNCKFHLHCRKYKTDAFLVFPRTDFIRILSDSISHPHPMTCLFPHQSGSFRWGCERARLPIQCGRQEDWSSLPRPQSILHHPSALSTRQGTQICPFSYHWMQIQGCINSLLSASFLVLNCWRWLFWPHHETIRLLTSSNAFWMIPKCRLSRYSLPAVDCLLDSEQSVLLDIGSKFAGARHISGSQSPHRPRRWHAVCEESGQHLFCWLVQESWGQPRVHRQDVGPYR